MTKKQCPLSDDLVKHLRNSKGWPTLGNAAADRVEELEAKLAKAEVIVRIIASAEFDERIGEAVDLSCEYLAGLEGGGE